MTDEQRLELMLEYVAGALEAPDAERVRLALASNDPAWAAAYGEAQATLAAYAGAINPVKPPLEVKSELMTRIARDQDARLRGEALPTHDRHRFGRRLAQTFAAMAAMVFLGVLVNQWTNRRIETARAQERQWANNQLKDRDARIMVLQTMIERDQSLFKVMHSPQLKWVDLGGGKAVGRILIEPDKSTWHLFATSLTPLSSQRTYQLWLITPQQKMVPAGTFSPDPAGNGNLTLTVPQGVGDIAQAAITEEPAGGSPQPTTLPPVLAGKL